MEGIFYLMTLALICGLSEAGVVYTRWGRTKCPAGNIPLYKGYAVGPQHNKVGGGSNTLCAPETPKKVRENPGYQDWTARLVGIEYELYLDQIQFLGDNINGEPLENQDAVCVVCYVGDSSTVMMIPGRDDCMDTGFELQYKGFLVASAEYGDRQRTEYVCLDEAPEGRPGGNGDNNQGTFYIAQFDCGSLPCNPYTTGTEVTCAVCTY